MARKPIAPPRKPGFASEGAPRQAFVARRGNSPMEPGHVVHISVDARALVTIGPEHDVWRGGHIRENIDGAIVRMFPPAGANPGAIQIVEGAVRSVAAAVKVMPAAPDDRVLVESPAPSPESVQSIREVVYEMVTVARTGNRDLLVDVVEEAICAAGL